MLQKAHTRKTYKAHPSLGLPVHERNSSRKVNILTPGQQEFEFNQDAESLHNNTRRILIDKIVRSAPVAITSALIGLSIAIVMSGVAVHLNLVFVPRESVVGAILGGTLAALSVGVGVPQRFAMWICTCAWRRFLTKGQPSEMSNVLIHPDNADRPLYWMVLSVISLIGGIASAMLPLSLYFSSSFYNWLHVHFVWSSLPLEMLHVGIAFVVTLIPLGLLGIALTCVHHLSCPYGRWETLATGWLLVGASVGCMMGQGLSSSMLLVASSLPAFLVALIATGVSSSRHLQLAPPRQDAATWLPLQSDRWGGLLRASIVAVGGGSACAIIGWTGSNHGRLPGSTLLFVMLLSLGVGVITACKAKKAGLRSIGGFGVACAVAGVVTATVTSIVHHFHTNGFIMILSIGSAMFAIGFSMAYGRKTLLARVASKSTTGAKMMANLIVCAAVMVWIGDPLMTNLIGSDTTLLIVALSLMALGGILIIYEPTYSPRTRQHRLWAVFGSVAVMIILASLSSNPWRSKNKTHSTTLKNAIMQHSVTSM